jgi:murein DD-endopeptidase MepM/ murein hydrolase activator NlpD
MKRTDFLIALKSPLPNAILKEYPAGNVMQLWGENPELYSAGMDSFHVHLGGHMGVDIATFHRDPVYAAHEGMVVIVNGSDRTRQGGLEVWITSPELDGEEPGNSRIQTVYCHLDEIAVKLGQTVSQGDLIGYEGNTGMVISGGKRFWGNAPQGVGTHLHFGLYEDIKRNGTWERRYHNPLRDSVDPLPYISETAENPLGNLAGLSVVLKNIAKYLSTLRWS